MWQRVSDVLKDPSLLDAGAVEEVAAAACSSASEGGSNSGCRSCDGDSDGAGQAAAGVALLARLRADIVRCQRADRAYSNFSDMAKNVAGALAGGAARGDGVDGGWPARCIQAAACAPPSRTAAQHTLDLPPWSRPGA